MTRGQFEILLSRLDDIDARLREVEVESAGARAVRRARQDNQLDVKWRAGIIASILGGVLTLVAKVYEALTNGGN